VLPAGAAHAVPTVALGDTGSLAAGGATVTVSVNLTCDPMPTPPVPEPGPVTGTASLPHLTVVVFEVVGNRIALGFGEERDFPCDGTTQSGPVHVTPASLGGFLGLLFAPSFGPGNAFAIATLENCSLPASPFPGLPPCRPSASAPRPTGPSRSRLAPEQRRGASRRGPPVLPGKP
jgi:hypothetical protein